MSIIIKTGKNKIGVDRVAQFNLYVKLLKENKAVLIKRYIGTRDLVTHKVRCYEKFLDYEHHKIRLTPEMYWKIMTIARETGNYLLIDKQK